MNRTETAQLLTAVAAFDRRTIGDMDVMAWQSVLAAVPYEDALLAVKAWYAEKTEWIMPAHVRAGVAAIEKKRQVSPWKPGLYGVPRDQVEALPPASDRRAGADMVRHVLRRIKEAGSDPENGVLLGKERCGDIAVDAVEEWLARTAPPTRATSTVDEAVAEVDGTLDE